MKAQLLLLHALSPLHAGIGQGVGVIDLPIAREKATGLPYLPGSSLKGTLRDECKDPDSRKRVFGPSSEDNPSEFASSIQLSDQRLLLLPVRSLIGTFAWVTSPYTLQRFMRDAQSADVKDLPARIPQPESEQQCFVAQNNEITKAVADNRQVVLEDMDLHAVLSDQMDNWAAWLSKSIFAQDPDGQRLLTGRLCIVHDNLLSFLLETATEITARIKLLEKAKTVDKGGLWYEEALPTETILSGLIVATPIKASVDEVFRVACDLIKKPLQFGGKATVGRGLCRLYIVRGEA